MSRLNARSGLDPEQCFPTIHGRPPFSMEPVGENNVAPRRALLSVLAPMLRTVPGRAYMLRASLATELAPEPTLEKLLLRLRWSLILLWRQAQGHKNAARLGLQAWPPRAQATTLNNTATLPAASKSQAVKASSCVASESDVSLFCSLGRYTIHFVLLLCQWECRKYAQRSGGASQRRPSEWDTPCRVLTAENQQQTPDIEATITYQ